MKENIIETKEEDFKKEVNEESKVYRFEEMHDEMLQSINNVQKIKEDQNHLIETLEEVNKPEFEALINSMKEQLVNLGEQIEVMNIRKDALKEVLEISKENETVKFVLEKLIIALGLFKE